MYVCALWPIFRGLHTHCKAMQENLNPKPMLKEQSFSDINKTGISTKVLRCEEKWLDMVLCESADCG